MVEIALGYYFERDKKIKNYTLIFKEVRKKFEFGTMKELDEVKEVKTTIGYYSSIEQMCKATAEDFVTRKADAGEVTNIHEWLTEYRKTVNELIAAINGDNKEETNND